jgi:hypothetical protein
MRKSMVAYNKGEVAGEWMRWDEQGRLHEFAVSEPKDEQKPQAGPNLLIPDNDDDGLSEANEPAVINSLIVH